MLLIGARGVGKSTLLEAMFADMRVTIAQRLEIDSFVYSAQTLVPSK